MWNAIFHRQPNIQGIINQAQTDLDKQVAVLDKAKKDVIAAQTSYESLVQQVNSGQARIGELKPLIAQAQANVLAAETQRNQAEAQYIAKRDALNNLTQSKNQRTTKQDMQTSYGSVKATVTEVIGRANEYGGISGDIVSRQHALVYRDTQRNVLGIADYNSRNGVHVNGALINGYTELQLNDQVLLGTPGDVRSALLTVKTVNGKLELVNSSGQAVRGKATQSPPITRASSNGVNGLISKSPIQAIDAGVSNGLKPRIEIHGGNYKGNNLTVNELYIQKLQPKYSMQIDGVQYYLSDLYSIGDGRLAGVVYVQDGSTLVARTYYRSNSSAVWRYLPGYSANDNGQVTWYSKGYGEEGVNAPLQLQQAMSNLSEEGSLAHPADDQFIFAGLAQPQRITSTYIMNVWDRPEFIPLQQQYAHEGDELPRPESLQFTDSDDAPDFGAYLASWEENTSLYGVITKEAFASKNKKYTYVFYRDTKGRAGLSFVENHSEIVSQGIRQQWVNIGAMTTPIFEYDSQTGGYGNANKRNGHYVDMYDNYLSHIQVIKDYQSFVRNGVPRTTAAVTAIPTDELDRLNQQIAQAQSEYEQARSLYSQQAGNVDALRQQLVALQTEFETLAQGNTTVQGARTSLERQQQGVGQIQTQVDALEGRLTALRDWNDVWQKLHTLDPNAYVTVNLNKATEQQLRDDIVAMQTSIDAINPPSVPAAPAAPANPAPGAPVPGSAVGAYVSPVEWAVMSDEEKATTRLTQFATDRAGYDQKKAALFGTLPTTVGQRLTGFWAKVWNSSANFRRAPGDWLRRIRLAVNKNIQTDLKKKTVTVDVLARRSLLDDPAFVALVEQAKAEGNTKALRSLQALLDREVFKEVNAEHVTMISGISGDELSSIALSSGNNPVAFLSEDRGENFRIAIDNALENGQQPFAAEGALNALTPEQKARELGFWQKLFPGARGIDPRKNWSVSRNHSVVYEVTVGGKTYLFLPAHVDPKNAVAAFKKTAPGEQDALKYHQMEAGTNKSYVGTGLYDLGQALIIHLLDKAKEAGVVADVKVTGEEDLRTTGTITGDDAVTWIINDQVKNAQTQTAPAAAPQPAPVAALPAGTYGDAAGRVTMRQKALDLVAQTPGIVPGAYTARTATNDVSRASGF